MTKSKDATKTPSKPSFRFSDQKFSLKELEDMVEQSRDCGDGLDAMMGDEGFGCEIVAQLIAHIKKLNKEKK
ncbi:hypothetical protein [Achromobacter phage Motura]|uniref:Uncharacterized protein n=1 Tax=Achromobacter phage Motura TaxID=2591403 RepID=A0A514CSZ3_9CAUD|nr:hypothetical protein H1O15_gp208 [Achromobacter phage Motura]QDH83580.1 hypothetical protein [Achromobacter phage Motura]